MSDEIPIGPNPCPSCGMEYGQHITGCRNQRSRPPVYDLAEFERQLEMRVKWCKSMGGKYAQLSAEIFECILVDLRASKREAK